jgi:hypothetical protein
MMQAITTTLEESRMRRIRILLAAVASLGALSLLAAAAPA